MEIIILNQNSSCFVIEPIRTDILPYVLIAKSSRDALKAFHCIL